VSVPFDQTDVLTSLPDMALAPITSFGELIRESLRALLLATADPLQNYREGLESRGHEGFSRDIARIIQLRKQKSWTPAEANEGLALAQRYKDKNSEKVFAKMATSFASGEEELELFDASAKRMVKVPKKKWEKEKELKNQLKGLRSQGKKTKATFAQMAKIDRELAANASSSEAKDGFSSEADYFEKVASTMQGKEAPDEVKTEKEKKRQLVRASVWKALKNEKYQKKDSLVEAAAIMKNLNFLEDAAKIEKVAQKLQS